MVPLTSFVQDGEVNIKKAQQHLTNIVHLIDTTSGPLMNLVGQSL